MKHSTLHGLQFLGVPLLAVAAGGCLWRLVGGWTGFFAGCGVALYVVVPVATGIVLALAATLGPRGPNDSPPE